MVLPRARAWLHARVPDHSKDVYALLNEMICMAFASWMQPFWDELSSAERGDLMGQLVAQGFSVSKSFDVLVQWATARLRVRLTEQLRTAMWGRGYTSFAAACRAWESNASAIGRPALIERGQKRSLPPKSRDQGVPQSCSVIAWRTDAVQIAG